MTDIRDSAPSQQLSILVLDALPPWYRGGVQKVIGETAKQLTSIDNVKVEIRSGDLDSTKSQMWNGIPVKTYKTRRWQGYLSLRMLRELKRDLTHFDVLHVHGSGPFVPLIAALLKGKTPFILSPHYHPKASSFSRALAKLVYDRLFNAYVFRRASKVICVSDAEKMGIQQRFKMPASSLVTIPNGVDVETIAVAEPYDIDYKLILSVGRLERYKQNQLTIEAVRYLPKYYHFYLVGAGPYQKKLNATIQKRGVDKQVKILDSCDDDEVYRWLQTCSVLINLSEIEAFGITVLEALAAGKAIIVNNKLGLAELARKFQGFVFPVNQNQTNAVKLAALIEEVAATRIGRADLSAFHWNQIAQQFLRVYCDVSQSAAC